MMHTKASVTHANAWRTALKGHDSHSHPRKETAFSTTSQFFQQPLHSKTKNTTPGRKLQPHHHPQTAIASGCLLMITCRFPLASLPVHMKAGKGRWHPVTAAPPPADACRVPSATTSFVNSAPSANNNALQPRRTIFTTRSPAAYSVYYVGSPLTATAMLFFHSCSYYFCSK